MSEELRDEVQSALGEAYRIVRQLGDAGMSRVFVATDTRLGRDVVVKVLAPELAASISADRFAREIKLAAALQEPHIVPLLADGVTPDGLPYYTMPFVRGASVRQRMTEGLVPMPEVLGILTDVAKALAYAHARGVVHRDVKPENVLLSGTTAMVTDFGIAKAIEGARVGADAQGGRQGVRDTTLTGMGVSLGTPAYMAPEQALGDAIDGRTDLYAWGIMGYELLTGRHPFAGKTSAQQLIAAHVTEVVRPIASVWPRARRRERGAAALGAIIMRTIEKSQEKRPSSADELLRDLERVRSGQASSLVAPSWLLDLGPTRAWAVGGAVVVALAGVVAGTQWVRSRASADSLPQSAGTPAPARVAVAAFEIRPAAPELADFALTARDGISRRLAETRVAATLPGMEAAVTVTDALSRARTLGASYLVTGFVRRMGEQLEAHADLLDVASGQVVRSIGPEVGPLGQGERIIATLRERVVGTVALVLDPVVSDAIPPVAAQTPTYEAFRELAAGEAFAKLGQWSRTMESYQASFALDSTFTFAAGRLGRSYYAIGRCKDADSLGAILMRRRALLSEYERAAFDRTLARCRGDWAAAYDAGARMAALAPSSADANFVFAVSALGALRPAEAVRIFRAMKPDEPPMRLNLGYDAYYAAALHQLGRHSEERAVAANSQRRAPGSPFSYRLQLISGAALGDTAAVARLTQQIAALPLARPFFHAQLLLQASWELTRHGHAAAGANVAVTLADLLTAVPPERRDVAYWQARAEAMYALRRWRDARVAADSAQLVRTTTGTERSVFNISYGDPADFAVALRGRIAAREGRIVDAERAMAVLLSRRGPYLRGFPRRFASEIAAALGRRDEAVRLLRESILQGQNSVEEYLDARPDFAALAAYPPFEALFVPRG
ncbi:MAG: serine/threonine protein kinase [Gemmatimonadaceae bacterium]|nr:serine/threonine protein kinase [Gemmatimonadaceae bacterium]